MNCNLTGTGWSWYFYSFLKVVSGLDYLPVQFLVSDSHWLYEYSHIWSRKQVANIAGRAYLLIINKLRSLHVFFMFSEKTASWSQYWKLWTHSRMVRMVHKPALSSSGQPSSQRLALLLLLLVSVLQHSELVTGLVISGLLFGEFVFPGDGPKPEAGRLPGLMSGVIISFRISWV